MPVQQRCRGPPDESERCHSFLLHCPQDALVVHSSIDDHASTNVLFVFLAFFYGALVAIAILRSAMPGIWVAVKASTS